MTNYLAAALLFTFVSVFIMPNVASAGCSIVTTSSGSLNVRKKASTTASVIFKVARGSAVSVKKYYKKWAKIKLNNGSIGYVSRKHLSHKGDCGLVRIDSGRLNIHKHSQDGSKIIDKAAKHSAMRVLKYGYGWDKVKLNTGVIGYVVSGYIY